MSFVTINGSKSRGATFIKLGFAYKCCVCGLGVPSDNIDSGVLKASKINKKMGPPRGCRGGRGPPRGRRGAAEGPPRGRRGAAEGPPRDRGGAAEGQKVTLSSTKSNLFDQKLFLECKFEVLYSRMGLRPLN